MSDPLSVLRENFINKASMKADDQNITIGEFKFPRNTLTAYKQDRGRGDPYPLEALYFLLQNPTLAGAAKTRSYNDECKKKNFSRVLLVDQKDVLAYLTGKTETSNYLVSIDELASFASQPVPDKAEHRPEAEKKRSREEPKLDMSDETMRDAKRQLGQSLGERPLSGVVLKTPAEMRQVTSTDGLEPSKNAYITADAAVTRSLKEKERLLVHRHNFMHGKDGHQFQHLIGLVRTAFAGSAHHDRSAAPKPAGAPGQPQRRDRYNVEAKDAYKAAGIDAVLLSADKGSLLTAEPSKDASGGKGGGHEEVKLGVPIIMVPAGKTSLINALNVKELLEKGVFKTREQRVGEGAKREDKLTVTHLEEGYNGRYKVVDSPNQMRKEDWQRVVAVFVQGPEWQFKEYDLSSYGGKLVNFFGKVSAFYVEYEKTTRPATIEQWNVRVLTLHKEKRHMDEKAMNIFWDNLKQYRRLAVHRRGMSVAAHTR
uniref:Cell division control protein 73 C-terminal domain-containing protein n=2 Tax=Hemiselmis andersenii TaxID=464988 RepID=A0A6U2CV40_HEMAN|mmetsp:Transcript_22207/g.51601  ORF Transcript_22207/g.51601 Transcript_22207/m.51601 type:complete len:483 (+) Transcript_22207:13-1461(+)